MDSNVEGLIQTVIELSRASSWREAASEWIMIALDISDDADGICVCGQRGLVKLFSIENQITGNTLNPIGSSCIAHFNSFDLTRQARILEDLAHIRVSLASGSTVDLTAEHFSRSLIDWLYEQDVFTPDRWNFFDGWNDYDFLLSMFNKRHKDLVTGPQRRKIAAILNNKVFPFVRGYSRLR
jgi:hypothetical protein